MPRVYIRCSPVVYNKNSNCDYLEVVCRLDMGGVNAHQFVGMFLEHFSVELRLQTQMKALVFRHVHTIILGFLLLSLET